MHAPTRTSHRSRRAHPTRRAGSLESACSARRDPLRRRWLPACRADRVGDRGPGASERLVLDAPAGRHDVQPNRAIRKQPNEQLHQSKRLLLRVFSIFLLPGPGTVLIDLETGWTAWDDSPRAALTSPSVMFEVFDGTGSAPA